MPAGDVKADRKAETLARAQVGPPAAAYDLVVAYREIGHVHSLHEAFDSKLASVDSPAFIDSSR